MEQDQVQERAEETARNHEPHRTEFESHAAEAAAAWRQSRMAAYGLAQAARERASQFKVDMAEVFAAPESANGERAQVAETLERYLRSDASQDDPNGMRVRPGAEDRWAAGAAAFALTDDWIDVFGRPFRDANGTPAGAPVAFNVAWGDKQQGFVSVVQEITTSAGGGVHGDAALWIEIAPRPDKPWCQIRPVNAEASYKWRMQSAFQGAHTFGDIGIWVQSWIPGSPGSERVALDHHYPNGLWNDATSEIETDQTPGWPGWVDLERIHTGPYQPGWFRTEPNRLYTVAMWAHIDSYASGVHYTPSSTAESWLNFTIPLVYAAHSTNPYS